MKIIHFLNFFNEAKFKYKNIINKSTIILSNTVYLKYTS